MPNFNFYFVILYILQIHIPTNVPPLHREPFCMYFASLFQGKGDVACCFRGGGILFVVSGEGDVACFRGGGCCLLFQGGVACCFRGDVLVVSAEG